LFRGGEGRRVVGEGIHVMCVYFEFMYLEWRYGVCSQRERMRSVASREWGEV
jgi:hypothetical protein